MRLPHWGDFEPDEWIVEARGEEDAIEISSEASAGGNDPEGASASPNIDDKIQLDVWSKNVTSILSEARLILSSLRSRGGGGSTASHFS